MKLFAFAVVAWSVAVAALILAVPGYVDTPGCAHRITLAAGCAAQMAAESDALFRLHTLALVATIVGGYVVFAGAAAALVRRARRRSS